MFDLLQLLSESDGGAIWALFGKGSEHMHNENSGQAQQLHCSHNDMDISPLAQKICVQCVSSEIIKDLINCNSLFLIYLGILAIFFLYKMQLWFLWNKRQGISMISDVDSYRAILKYILKA